MHALLLFAVFAMLLPPAVEYLALFMVFCCLFGSKGVFRRDETSTQAALPPSVRAIFFPTLLGTGAFVATSLFSSLIASAMQDGGATLGPVFVSHSHLLLKRCSAWLILITGFGLAYGRGFRMSQAAGPLVIFLGLYVIYGLIQRYTGIDWVHGWDTVLPPNRFDFDVFRVSGFMGHPISLSYNLMVLILVGIALLRARGASLTSRERTTWLATLALSVALLLISASRWPLMVIGATLVIADAKLLWRLRRWAGGVLLILAAALWLEKSLVQRLLSMADGAGSVYDRFPRLLFWKIHWRMFLDHPIAGVGYDAYDKIAPAYYVAAGYGDFREKYAAHNIYLQTLADGGLIGFAGLVVLAGGFIVAARRVGALGTSRGVTYLLVATALGGLMQNLLRDSTYLYALWLGLAIVAVEGASRQDSRPAKST